MTSHDDEHRLLHLIDAATDTSELFGPVQESDRTMDNWHYGDPDDSPSSHEDIARVSRRLREMEVYALAAIALLLLRRDEEMHEAWKRY